MGGLLLIGANRFHLQALAAAPIPGHEVRTVIVHTFLADEVVARFPDAELITFPMVYAAEAKGANEKSISALAPHEAETLLMLDRFNRWGASLMATRGYYLKLLGYCFDLLSSHDFSSVVFYNIPHQGVDYIIYLLALSLRVPIAIINYTQIDSRVMIRTYMEECIKPSSLLDSKYEQLVQFRPSQYMEEGVPKQRSAEFHISRSKKLRPASYSLDHLLRRARRAVEDFPVGIPDQSLNGLSRFRLNRAQQKEHSRAVAFYRSASKPKPGSVEYVFFPLQLQPEATTLPRAGYMLDQVNFARLVASALPEGWRLAIKEHPASLRFSEQICRARSTHFYSELASLPNCDLLDFECDTDALIRGCRFLITGTGTPGWEAINQGRPVIVFGWPWYLGAPGVTRATSAQDLRALFNDDSRASGPSSAEIGRYLTWFMTEGSAPGRYGLDKTSNGLSHADLQAYTHAIAAALARASAGEVKDSC